MNQVQESGGKDYGISFARMISMIMIVLCHVFQFHDHELAWWFNCGVQIFLCISGFLYGQKEIKDGYVFIKKGFWKILSEYYICLLFSLGLYYLFMPELLSVSGVINLIFCSGTIKGVGHFWFIATILLCYLLTPLFSKITEERLKEIKAGNIFSVLFILGIGHIVLELFVPHFKAAWIVCYFLGFLIGRVRSQKGELWWKYTAVLVLPLGILMNGIQIYQDYILHHQFSHTLYAVLYSRFCNYAHVMLGISLFLLFYGMYSLLPGKALWRKILKISDKYSYEVYLSHHLWVNSPMALFHLPLPTLAKIVLILLAIGLESVLIHYLAERINGIKTLYLAKKDKL